MGNEDITYVGSPDGGGGAPDAGDDTTRADAAITCLDTKSDAKNCGVCGRSCVDAKCVDSACVAVPLVPDIQAGVALTVGGGILVWAEQAPPFGAKINSCLTSACAPRVLVNLGSPALSQLTNDGKDAYFSVNADIARAPLTAVDAGPPEMIPSGGSIHGLAAAAGSVYFTTQSPSLVAKHDFSTLTSISPIAESPGSIAIGPGGLAWDDGAAGNHSILVCRNLAACTPTTFMSIASQRPTVGLIAVDDRAVYWTEGVKVLTCSFETCATPTTLATFPATATIAGLAAGGGFAFASVRDASQDAVYRIATSAPAAPLLLARATRPAFIAVDDAYVYWMQTNPHAIFKTAR